MKIFLRKPTDAQVQAMLATQADAPFTYQPVGATAAKPLPTRYPGRERVTEFAGDFARAKDALQRWHQYDLGWCHIAEPRPAIAVGHLSATVARVWGMWTVNCCRIVDVVDEPGHFSYTIGTLPLHSEIGEERFELEQVGGKLRFTIRSFSGPSWWLPRVGWFVADRLINRFLREATSNIRAAAQA